MGVTMAWFQNGCSDDCILSGRDVVILWAWMLRLSDALAKGCDHGLGMGALGSKCAVTQVLMPPESGLFTPPRVCCAMPAISGDISYL